MAIVNITNACVAGAMDATLQNRSNVSAVSSAYAISANAVGALVAALDTAGMNDATVNSVAKTNLLSAICAGVIAGRPIVSAVSTDYAIEAAAIKAAYTSAATKLV
jgi:hypothetical protein